MPIPADELARRQAAQVGLILMAGYTLPSELRPGDDTPEQAQAKWTQCIESVKRFAFDGVSSVRSHCDEIPAFPHYSEADYIAGHLAHAVRGHLTLWLAEVVKNAQTALTRLTAMEPIGHFEVKRFSPVSVAFSAGGDFGLAVEIVEGNFTKPPQSPPEKSDQPAIDISAAIQSYLNDYTWGDETWIDMAHEGYPLGVDVQIEEDPDHTTPDFGFLKAWVYPNVQQGEYVSTDTSVLLAAIPERLWPKQGPKG